MIDEVLMSACGTSRRLARCSAMSGIGRRPEVSSARSKWRDWPRLC